MDFNLPLVHIIILNWNGLKDTIECLESVYKLDYSNFKVVVVDNGSSDNSADVIYKNYPKIKLIINDKNYGFTGGNNIGMKYAIDENTDYLWLLNNDTLIEKDCLYKIVKVAESSNTIGMVSPMIYYAETPDKLQFGGCWINRKQLRHFYPQSSVDIGSEFQTGNDVCLWGRHYSLKEAWLKKLVTCKKNILRILKI